MGEIRLTQAKGNATVTRDAERNGVEFAVVLTALSVSRYKNAHPSTDGCSWSLPHERGIPEITNANTAEKFWGRFLDFLRMVMCRRKTPTPDRDCWKQTVVKMKNKTKLENITNVEEIKRKYESIKELESIAPDVIRTFKHLLGKESKEEFIKIKSVFASISEKGRVLGEELTALGLLPHKPKPARRVASTKVK